MAYRDNYKSVQLNLSKKKHQAVIKWLEEKCSDEERSINSFIINLLKKEYLKDEQSKGNNL